LFNFDFESYLGKAAAAATGRLLLAPDLGGIPDTGLEPLPV
jgi:hypothetical protein